MGSMKKKEREREIIESYAMILSYAVEDERSSTSSLFQDGLSDVQLTSNVLMI